MPTIAEILARIGEDPARLCTLTEILDVLKKAGFPVSRAAIYKHQMAGTGPEYFIYGNYRAIYKIGDVLDWAVSRTAKLRGRSRATRPAAIASVAPARDHVVGEAIAAAA